jgi:hypothetical protein
MKRDMELIRKILLAVEDSKDASRRGFRPEIDGYEDEVIQAHVGLLWNKGLLKAMDGSSRDGESYIITGLTWEGYDFIEAARNEAVWRKAIHVVMEKGGGITLEIMSQLLKKLLQQHVLGNSGGEVI